MSETTFRPFDRAADLGFQKEAMLHAFNTTADRVDTYVDLVGPDELRILEQDGRPAATLARLPMHQFFGPDARGAGRVSMLGIAAVAVAPEARGGGVARELMSRTLREARDQGFAISTLYSAMHRLYRGVGYELAGLTCTCRAPLDALRETAGRLRRAGAGAVAVRPFEEHDRPGVERLAAERSSQHHGHLLRTPFFWKRITELPGPTTRGFVAEAGGEVVGHVFFTRGEHARGRAYGEELRITDWCWREGAAGSAAAAILGLVGGFSNQVRDAVWSGSPDDAAMRRIDNPRYGSTEVRETWMVRVVDVRRAVAERGYLSGIDTEVDLEIEDAVLPGNAGRWRLRVSGGRGSLERSEAAGEALRLDAREFAGVWAGFLDPRRPGVLRAGGAPELLGRLASAFGGFGTAVNVDFF